MKIEPIIIKLLAAKCRPMILCKIAYMRIFAGVPQVP